MKKAVVLLSGGMDSATTLAIAHQAGFLCYALSIDYGQRHHSELQAAANIGNLIQVASHQFIKLDLTTLASSALTDPSTTLPTKEEPGEIPITYVPARNTIMLSLALAWAEVLQSYDIFIGVTAVDYSGYPDCRPDYIAAFQKMTNLATKAGREGKYFQIHAPLINCSKAAIIRKGITLGLDYSLTVSCYQADESGHACGHCNACRIRHAGFIAAGIADPTRYQEK
ncbi:7-cyano-7-deazaguanine synthase QueC [Nitrosomonas mobilis]|uniref:7-cyano-7-deazaguanine synthase n=1 Tax=Nitrosomonas mobilis TaxID=51642 RepID=A0A1G5SE90_9PROT|nr:7-cyano-7-deazaguanine synthase QueC [Nitrosomonas mobilis]SCZ85170.1 7-cyano-7-deazaguanine synthase [Nitrosomonas mobilis]HNO75443.1 7-cyano-7-deazaguanine synthase QueC [Nitrosomonas mobilis]